MGVSKELNTYCAKRLIAWCGNSDSNRQSRPVAHPEEIHNPLRSLKAVTCSGIVLIALSILSSDFIPFPPDTPPGRSLGVRSGLDVGPGVVPEMEGR